MVKKKSKNEVKLKSPLSMDGTLKATEIRKNKNGSFTVIQELEVSREVLERRLEQLERVGEYKDMVSELKSILK